MKKTIFVIMLLCVLLSACAPPPVPLETAIANTVAAWTPTASNPPPPTDTPAIAQTPTATFKMQLETILQQQGFIRAPDLDSKCNVECSSWVYGDRTVGSSYLIAIALGSGIGLVFPLDSSGNIDTTIGALATSLVQKIYGPDLVNMATQDVVSKKVYTTQSGDYNYQTHFSKDGKYYEIIITK